jgi:hypothetical protein
VSGHTTNPTSTKTNKSQERRETTLLPGASLEMRTRTPSVRVIFRAAGENPSPGGMTSAAELCDTLSMPFSRIAEDRIREAMAQGQFENLPGAGRPLNLEEYFRTSEDLRMVYSILTSASGNPVDAARWEPPIGSLLILEP